MLGKSAGTVGFSTLTGLLTANLPWACYLLSAGRTGTTQLSAEMDSAPVSRDRRTLMAFGGEFDLNIGQGQFALYGPAASSSLNINYINGENPITVSGINFPPPASSQGTGTNQTYTIQNPENGVVVNYTGSPITIQWNWLP
jgi:hypothetical protein